MKNITVSVDDKVYHAARVEAALRRKSLSALVREFLVELESGVRAADPKIERRNRAMEALLRRSAHFRMGRPATREEMNAR